MNLFGRRNSGPLTGHHHSDLHPNMPHGIHVDSRGVLAHYQPGLAGNPIRDFYQGMIRDVSGSVLGKETVQAFQPFIETGSDIYKGAGGGTQTVAPQIIPNWWAPPPQPQPQPVQAQPAVTPATEPKSGINWWVWIGLAGAAWLGAEIFMDRKKGK